MTPRETVLSLTARGLKDKAVAREASISVRTVRRHIAEYMTAVGATSRFQAGGVGAVEQHSAIRETMAP